MSNSNKDIADEMAETTAGCLWGILAAIIGVVGALIAGIFLHDRNKVKLPDSFEPLITKSRNASNFVKTIPVIVLGVVVSAYGIIIMPFVWEVPFVAIILAIVVSVVVYFSIPLAETQLPQEEDRPLRDDLVAHRWIITLPKETQWHPEQAWHFAEQLIKVVPRCLLQIHATPSRLTWEVIAWRSQPSDEDVVHVVHTYYPEAEVTSEAIGYTYSNEWSYPFYRYTFHFRHFNDFVWPIQSVFNLKPYDPLGSLTHAIAHLQEGERVTYVLAISIPADYAYTEGEKLITISRIHPLQFLSAEGRGYALGTALSGKTRDERYREIDQKQARSKLNSQLFQAFLMVQIDSPHIDRLSHLSGVDAHIWEFQNQPYNALVWCEDPLRESVRRIETASDERSSSILTLLNSWVEERNQSWKLSRLILSTEEIAALWHLPHEGFTAPTIQWVSGKRVPAPIRIAQVEQGVYIGDNVHAGKTTPIRLQDYDRQGHIYIIGKTGFGKSTLLHHIIHQDIAAGKGVGVIDPHGTLVADIMRSSIPREREDDVVLIDVGNSEYPPPLNPFAIPAGVPRQVALDQILGVLKKIYAEDWSATRMESAIYSALAALLYDPEATPRDIPRMFLDPVYRQQLLRQVDDPVALEYWYDEYDNLASGVQKQTREPVLNRMRIFYRNPVIRNMVCHPHQIDFRRVIKEKKILLANLKSDETKSEKENLGALLIANLQLAALSSRVGAGEKPTNFYLVVDEVQQFITTSLPETFSEARKFGLSLTVANQYLGQLAGSTLDSIFGNVGAVVIYGCGPSDARSLSVLVQPEFSANDLINFDRFRAAAKIQVNGRSLPAFSLQSPEPLSTPRDAQMRVKRIWHRSMKNYTPWTKQEVEQWQKERYSLHDRSRPIGEVQDYD
jgi:hypothetical protein